MANSKTDELPPTMSRLSGATSVWLVPFLAAHFAFLIHRLVLLVNHGPPNYEADWLHLKLVAEHFVAGNWDHLYSVGPEAINPGYFWRYPPYALYLVAPLAWLSRELTYVVLAGVEVLALAGSLVMLRRLAPSRGMTAEWALAIAASAPMLTTIISGQSSALLLLCVVGAASLWTRDRTLAACAVLGLLALKPNWGIFFGFYVLVRREWRGAVAMSAVVAGLCALTLPLGTDLWVDFIRVSLSNVDLGSSYEPYKLITLKGFFGVLFGQNSVSLIAWGVSSLVLLVVAAWSWKMPGPPARALALVVLLAIAANPYGFFYDALLLALPATLWWSERFKWRQAPWLAVGWLIAALWIWEHYSYSYSNVLGYFGLTWLPPFSIVGPGAAVWLILAARESSGPCASLPMTQMNYGRR